MPIITVSIPRVQPQEDWQEHVAVLRQMHMESVLHVDTLHRNNKSSGRLNDGWADARLDLLWFKKDIDALERECQRQQAKKDILEQAQRSLTYLEEKYDVSVYPSGIDILLRLILSENKYLALAHAMREDIDDNKCAEIAHAITEFEVETEQDEAIRDSITEYTEKTKFSYWVDEHQWRFENLLDLVDNPGLVSDYYLWREVRELLWASR